VQVVELEEEVVEVVEEVEDEVLEVEEIVVNEELFRALEEDEEVKEVEEQQESMYSNVQAKIRKIKSKIKYEEKKVGAGRWKVTIKDNEQDESDEEIECVKDEMKEQKEKEMDERVAMRRSVPKRQHRIWAGKRFQPNVLLLPNINKMIRKRNQEEEEKEVTFKVHPAIVIDEDEDDIELVALEPDEEQLGLVEKPSKLHHVRNLIEEMQMAEEKEKTGEDEEEEINVMDFLDPIVELVNLDESPKKAPGDSWERPGSADSQTSEPKRKRSRRELKPRYRA